jgi:hypothetical protein
MRQLLSERVHTTRNPSANSGPTLPVAARLLLLQHAGVDVVDVGDLKRLQTRSTVPLLHARRPFRGHAGAGVVAPGLAFVALYLIEFAAVIADVAPLLAQSFPLMNDCGRSAGITTTSRLRIVVAARGGENDSA